MSEIKFRGADADYYKFPEGVTELQDLIEHKKMSFALGNIFKAAYRLGEKSGTSLRYDLEKIVFFALRMLKNKNRKQDEIQFFLFADEYRWYARDEDGNCFLYADKPVLYEDGGYWEPPDYAEKDALPVEGMSPLIHKINKSVDWKDSLIERD